MDTVKSVILIACIIGIISTFFEFSLPSGGVKKGFGLLIGAVTALALITPFTNEGFQLALDEFKTEQSQQYYSNKISDEIDDLFLEKSAKQIEEYFLNKLNKNGIKAEEIDISLEINDQNEIEIKKTEVRGANENDKDKIKELIEEELKETQIAIITEDNSEA